MLILVFKTSPEKEKRSRGEIRRTHKPTNNIYILVYAGQSHIVMLFPSLYDEMEDLN